MHVLNFAVAIVDELAITNLRLGWELGPPRAALRVDGDVADREAQLGDVDLAKTDQRVAVKRIEAATRDRELAHGGAPHFSRMVLSDSCSGLFTTSQRCHAVGSINLTISCSTQLRRSFGSIASSSQHRSP